MTTPPPITVGETEWDRGLWWMVLVSAGLHVVAVGLLLLTPHTFLHHPPPLQSWTVDIVDPNKVGGTNMIRGSKGRVAAPPIVAPPEQKVEPPKPPPPKAVEAKPAEPPKPPPDVAKPVPPPEPPKLPEKPKDDELALAEKMKTIAPPPPTVPPVAPTAPPAATAVPQKPQPPATPTIDVQAVKVATAKAAKEAKETAAAKAAKAAADAKAAKETAAAKAAKEVADAKAAKEAADAKSAKQAADAKAAKEAADAKARDSRIAAAIRRVGESQAGAHGGGTGDKPGAQPGGSISVGPGEGAGGVVVGVEYLLYYNLLQNRIKESWAWAGTNPSLEAVVRFNISESGEVMNVRITKSSGDAGFDSSVERAVRTLNPLPPPPEKYRQQFSDVEVPFSLAQFQH